MPSPTPPPPDPIALQRRSRRYRLADFVLLGLLLPANACLLVAIVLESSLYSVFVSLILFALSYLIHLGWTHSLFLKSKRQIAELGSLETVGRYRAAEIYLMLQEILAPHRSQERPRVYLTRDDHDGAYVVNSLFFNAVRPLNAVYLSERLFHILKPGEIKAVLAHELAHFYHYLRPLGRARFALMAFNALLPLYIALDHGVISFWKTLLLWLVFSSVYHRFLAFWLSKAARDHEYLCDLHAARRFGILNLVNGLVGVVRLSEIQNRLYRSLLQRIRNDATLSLQSLETLLQRCQSLLGQGPVSPQKLDAIVAEVLQSKQSSQLRQTLAPRALKQEERQIQELVDSLLLDRAFALMDWKHFEIDAPDGRIDPHEYPRLLQRLASHPQEQLFDLPSDNPELSRHGSHPTVAQRIQFLEQARALDPSLALSR